MKKRKNIYNPKRVLILGNGFDLAHGLPTRYSDFLEFCETVCIIYTCPKSLTLNGYIKKAPHLGKMNDYIKNILYDAFNSRTYRIKLEGLSHDKDVVITFNKALDELYAKIKENIWYDYFSNKILYRCLGRNWVDFESEIKLCIKYIDENSIYLSRSVEDLFEKSTYIGDEDNANIRYSAFKSAVLESSKEVKDIFDLRKVLYEDLKNLTQALEIYLRFVESIPITLCFNDIPTLGYNYVLNFNYTRIYEYKYDMYNYYKLSEVFYIHGELNHKPNNMVLGIDEYWPEEERNSHTNFTIFKKFAQRIQKKTGIESYKWFDEIKSDYEKNNDVAKVFIFGHSLDVTDKDILYDYLESEATDVTIYCKDEETECEYIANVIKIIGEKRLLEKVNQYPPKLRFVIQQPMVPIDKEEEELSTSGAAT